MASSNTTVTSMRAIMLQIISNLKIYNRLQREIDDHIERGLISSPILDEGSRKIPYLQEARQRTQQLLESRPPGARPILSRAAGNHRSAALSSSYQDDCTRTGTPISDKQSDHIYSRDCAINKTPGADAAISKASLAHFKYQTVSRARTMLSATFQNSIKLLVKAIWPIQR